MEQFYLFPTIFSTPPFYCIAIHTAVNIGGCWWWLWWWCIWRMFCISFLFLGVTATLLPCESSIPHSMRFSLECQSSCPCACYWCAFNGQSLYFILLTTEIGSGKVVGLKWYKLESYLAHYIDTKGKTFSFHLNHEL